MPTLAHRAHKDNVTVIQNYVLASYWPVEMCTIIINSCVTAGIETKGFVTDY